MRVTKTKGRKIEGPATVSDVHTWMHPTGPQWENPAIDFTFNGETLYWRASSEHLVEGLRVGTVVHLRAFVRDEASLYRVTWTPVS